MDLFEGNNSSNHLTTLIDVNDCLLIVIDVQGAFLEKLPPEEAKSLVGRIVWLMQVADRLGVPMIGTAEDVTQLGGLVDEVGDVLPENVFAKPGEVAVFNKMVFGLADQPDILAAVEKVGRKTAVLVGLETDVCVAHSALGLLQKGCNVVAIIDATASPENSHAIGLERMKRAGVLLMSCKSLFYEWVRTVKNAESFWAKYKNEIEIPDSIIL